MNLYRLVERFGVDEFLVGDLIEQRQSGRSRAWLCHQLVVALLAAVARDVVAHPLRSTIAVLVAMVLHYVTINTWGVYGPSIDMTIGGMILDAVALNRPA